MQLFEALALSKNITKSNTIITSTTIKSLTMTDQTPQRPMQAWEQLTSSFPLASQLPFTPTQQLQRQPHPFTSRDTLNTPVRNNSDGDSDASVSSDDEVDFSFIPHAGEGSLDMSAAEPEDIDEEHVEQIQNPTSSQGLPRLPPFKPLSGIPYTRSWRLPSDFATGPRVTPPERCLDSCCYNGRNEYCLHRIADDGSSERARWDLPFLFFGLFFTDEVFDIITSNTNKYAESKGAGQENRRPWKEVTAAEMMIWIGHIIYISVVRLNRTGDYWARNGEWPIHCIMRFRGFNRFMNIKRFFHLSPPTARDLPASRFYEKLEPIATILRQRFKAIITPATQVSIDEIIVRCTGRSSHTVMMRGKPCPKGFNVLAICEAGYCYSFFFSSKKTGFPGVAGDPTEGVFSAIHPPDPAIKTMAQALSKTSKAVLALILQLPRHLYYTLYCDNLFSNADLFHVFAHFGIAACGTARSTSKNWPELFKQKIKRKTTRLPFNYQSGIVVHGDVMAVVWQDKNLVQFLTTHVDPGDHTLQTRRKPSASNSSKWYKDTVQAIWGNHGEVLLNLPIYSIDYNFNMGGVDRHDQMRSYSPTQLISFRT